MTRVRVKICGITRLADAQLAVQLGADAIGFVFWPRSPRAIAARDAAAIAKALPGLVTRVGVFVDAAADDVARVVRTVGLDAVQLHGAEKVEGYRTIGARLLRSVHLETSMDIAKAAALSPDVTPLVDAIDRERLGGTGKTADWAKAAALAKIRPIVLAGGLLPETVGQAVLEVKPWGVDVSSGVESAPGIKSQDRLRAFFAALDGLPRAVAGRDARA